MENLPKVRMIICGSCGDEKRWNAVCERCGRPITYKPYFSLSLYKHLIDGRSYSSFAKVIGVSRSTLYLWENSHKEFFQMKLYGTYSIRIKRLLKKLT